MEYSEWKSTKNAHPNDSSEKLVTIKEGNYYHCMVARFEVNIQKWLINNKKVPANLEVCAWIDIPGVYLD